MATYTSNYGWTKPSGSDNVDISVLNNNLDDQDSTIHDAFLNMAPPFSESSTYAVDDIVLYGTGLYKCHTAVVTPGSWTGSTNWQVYKLSEGGSGGGGTTNYNALTNKPQINSVELSGNKTSAQLGLMASDGVVANPTGQTTGTLTALEVGGTKYAVPSGGGGTSDYTDLTNKPSINGVTLSGNKTTSDLGITASGVGAIPSTDKGANGGVAELDSNGLVPISQLPSYVDDVLEGTAQNVTETGAGTYSATGFILSGESSPCVPESGKTYVDTTSNIQYRWTGTGTNFVSMGSNLALGETSSTAYRGDRGKTAYDHSQTTGNPHGTTKSDVGLGNVPNVSTNDQTPTFTEASTRNNIASGEKLSVIFGKIQKFFNDLKTVAFTGSYTDLINTPTIPTSASGISYDNTDSGLTATDTQGAVDEVVEKIGNVRMKKLWENPSPTASFVEQNITLSSADYDLLLIIYYWTTSSPQELSTIVEKSKGFVLSVGLPSSNGSRNMARYGGFTSNTVINFTNATDSVGASASTTNNERCIPIKIYGIKLT